MDSRRTKGMINGVYGRFNEPYWTFWRLSKCTGKN